MTLNKNISCYRKRTNIINGKYIYRGVSGFSLSVGEEYYLVNSLDENLEYQITILATKEGTKETPIKRTYVELTDFEREWI